MKMDENKQENMMAKVRVKQLWKFSDTNGSFAFHPMAIRKRARDFEL